MVGKVLGRYKMARRFVFQIDAASFSFARMQDNFAAEAALDSVCIIRTSHLNAEDMDGARCLRSYKTWPT